MLTIHRGQLERSAALFFIQDSSGSILQRILPEKKHYRRLNIKVFFPLPTKAYALLHVFIYLKGQKQGEVELVSWEGSNTRLRGAVTNMADLVPLVTSQGCTCRTVPFSTSPLRSGRSNKEVKDRHSLSLGSSSGDRHRPLLENIDSLLLPHVLFIHLIYILY